MIQLAELLLDLIIVSETIILGFIGFMIIQLISYRIFKFNIWKQMDKLFK